MSLKCVLLYEDFYSAQRAIEMSNALGGELNGGLEVDASVCRFDALNFPAMRRTMAESAVAAHLIVFSMHHQVELPAIVKSWIEDWLPEKREQPGVLVGLGDLGPLERAQPLYVYLQRQADQAGLDFFYTRMPRSRGRDRRPGINGFTPQTNQGAVINRVRQVLCDYR